MGGGEREAPGIPLGDVGDSGEDHEDGPADEGEQQDPLDDITDAAEGREGQEPGPDDPQLGDQDGDRRNAGGDVHSLGDPVQAGGTARDGQPRQRVLLEMGEQPGHEADREEDAERRPEPGGQALVAEGRW